MRGQNLSKDLEGVRNTAMQLSVGGMFQVDVTINAKSLQRNYTWCFKETAKGPSQLMEKE